MKKLLLPLLLLLLIPALAGCDGASGPQVEQTNGQLRLYLAPGTGSRYRDAVARFRADHPELELLVEDRSEREIGSDTEELRAELMAGRGPDVLLDPNRYFEDVNKASVSGLFADLTAYFEADPDFRREDYFENVLFGMQSSGYVVPLAFDVDCLLTTEEAAGEAGIDLGKCRTDCLSLLSEARRYLGRGLEPNAFNRPFYASSYPEFLGLPFLNYAERTADFSAQEFAEAALLYKDCYPQDARKDPKPYDMMAASQDILERRAVFSPVNAGSVHVAAISVSILGARETPVLFPVRGQDGRCFAWVQASAAVSAVSPNRQNAYEFIKLLLSPEWQNSLYAYLNFPILRAGMAYRAEEGKAITASGILEGEDGHPLRPLTDGFYGQLTTMADEVGHVGYKSDRLCTAVQQYMTPFYLGEKSFETCLAELQNAMTIYMTE